MQPIQLAVVEYITLVFVDNLVKRCCACTYRDDGTRDNLSVLIACEETTLAQGLERLDHSRPRFIGVVLDIDQNLERFHVADTKRIKPIPPRRVLRSAIGLQLAEQVGLRVVYILLVGHICLLNCLHKGLDCKSIKSALFAQRIRVVTHI